MARAQLYIFFLVLLGCSPGKEIARGPASEPSEYRFLNEANVLFGIEYSFQDAEIVAEPGRMTFRTPYKEEKFHQLFDAYIGRLELTRQSITQDTSTGHFKPGYQFQVPGDGAYTINMEPVTIEVNTTPKRIDQIVETSTPLFAAAEEVQLKPYVNPAAERSGMGHIHVGGPTYGESPFKRHPNLLRNLLVYMHKHPSLLYGFAEAYDIGPNSNIETYHTPERQEAFRKAVADFDDWYLRARRGEADINQGLEEFLRALKRHEPPGDRQFFHHYRNINLEHLGKIAENPPALDTPGKFTVEFRGFRPQKGPHHAEANARLLLDLMDTLADPANLEELRMYTPEEFKSFWTAGRVRADWEDVRRHIGHHNPYSEEMIAEFFAAVERTAAPLPEVPEARVYAAYSPKEHKGTAFEVRLPAHTEHPPFVQFGTGPARRVLQFERIEIQGTPYWSAYLDTLETSIRPEDLLAGQARPFVSLAAPIPCQSFEGFMDELLSHP